MGKPTYGNAYVSYPESIGIEKVTRGTETSKYPEEEKETSIPSVAASERGRAQTTLRCGVAGHLSRNIFHSRSGLERPIEEGKNPVDEMEKLQNGTRVPPGT